MLPLTKDNSLIRTQLFGRRGVLIRGVLGYWWLWYMKCLIMDNCCLCRIVKLSYTNHSNLTNTLWHLKYMYLAMSRKHNIQAAYRLLWGFSSANFGFPPKGYSANGVPINVMYPHNAMQAVFLEGTEIHVKLVSWSGYRNQVASYFNVLRFALQHLGHTQRIQVWREYATGVHNIKSEHTQRDITLVSGF